MNQSHITPKFKDIIIREENGLEVTCNIPYPFDIDYIAELMYSADSIGKEPPWPDWVKVEPNILETYTFKAEEYVLLDI